MMELAQETLAGRTAILHMSSLSQAELYGTGSTEPFTLSLPALAKRTDWQQPASALAMYERIWQGSMPGYRSGRYRDRELFYSSYVETYINRDVSEMIQGVDRLLFADFIRAAACRAGQMLNLHDIAKDTGVTDERARRWLQVLEKSEIIFYLRPYSNNLLNRTIKTPKMYFFDTGLVAYLTKYTTPEILMNGAINGAILENYTAAEIIKTYRNCGKSCSFYYYRDKDARDIDMVFESDGEIHPLEIKKSTNPGTEIASAFKVLDKSSVPRGTGAVLCLRETLSAVDRETLTVPIWMI